MSFKFDSSKMLRGIAETELKAKASLGLYADTVSKKMETHAKTNYPWTPRSGRAHQSLNSSWEWRGNKIVIALAHGVEYGIYLEFAHEKKYAIIQKTIDNISPKAITGLQNLLK